MAVAKSEKPKLFTRVKKSFRNTFQEMKRVHWPGKRDLAIYTVVVIGVSLVMSLFIYILDSGIGALMKLILK
ncbi:MAG: preprotein translocase subunit SecE [Peptococcaceae bacterium]|jgi:preprotein translocase subunit SecE|nr:preprotein translocase subunit SecE [Peptococcaceae bacterium]